MVSQPTAMRFKVELQVGDRIVTQVFLATNLMELGNKIVDAFPKSKVLSIIGGGGECT